MANDFEVEDILHDIQRWGQAYQILEKWQAVDCPKDKVCEKCGFEPYCSKAENLFSK